MGRFATAEDDFEAAFAHVRDFDCDQKKRARTFRERGIDFDDARHVFAGPIITKRSDRDGEVRYMVFGFLADVEVVYVCTIRGDICWIMSARRARRDERKKYHSKLARDAAQDQK
ncbi:MAG: BrnT family toxin [Pseudolabrys sp.]|nr:BrnT family toxin [Pseudolabrys sp.]